MCCPSVNILNVTQQLIKLYSNYFPFSFSIFAYLKQRMELKQHDDVF